MFLLHCRLVRNPLGSAHPEATLKACIEHGAPDDAIQAAKAEFHAYLAANRSAQAASSHDLVEDSELLSEDREMDSDSQGMNTIIRKVFLIKYETKLLYHDQELSFNNFSINLGPINISTTAILVSPGVAVSGTVSITSSEVYFEVDEEHPDYKKIDNQVGNTIKYTFMFRCSIETCVHLFIKSIL